MATTSVPPIPPDVAQQQAPPPLQQYAENAARQGPEAGAGAATGPKASMQFVLKKMASIANDMGEVAKVLAVEKPALMPVVTRAAGMLKMIEKEAQQSLQGQGSPMSGSEPAQAAMSMPEGPEAMGA